jgi:hypothetical protein
MSVKLCVLDCLCAEFRLEAEDRLPEDGDMDAALLWPLPSLSFAAILTTFAANANWLEVDVDEARPR